SVDRAFLKSISTIGADVLFVQRFGWSNQSYEDWMRSRNRKPISLTEAREVAKQMTQARAVSPVAQTETEIKYKGHSPFWVNVLGSTEQFLFTGGINIEHGRFFTSPEADSGRLVCVIGYGVATNLFQREPAVGKKIWMGKSFFEDAAVTEKLGDMFG